MNFALLKKNLPPYENAKMSTHFFSFVNMKTENRVFKKMIVFSLSYNKVCLIACPSQDIFNKCCL